MVGGISSRHAGQVAVVYIIKEKAATPSVALAAFFRKKGIN
jgi:hypothetical protein